MKLEKIDKTKTYVIGVSGGPDSMALLDMCRREGISLVIAHMNYQIRESAYRDMKIVEDYAQAYDIPCVIRMQEKECIGNFEAFAREQRYHFYAELLEKYHGEAVLLAHHLDDHLETYLMQKQRHSEGKVWGIQACTIIKGCRILRPLLSMSKQDVMDYCHRYQVPYGIDETNLSDDYTRNRIRHQIIEKMSYQEKQELNEQILQENIKKQETNRKWERFISNWQYTVQELSELSKEDIQSFLHYLLYDKMHIAINHHEIRQLIQLIQSGRDGWSRELANQYEIYQEYGKLCIELKDEVAYAYTYDHVQFEKTPYFCISQTGSSVEALTLTRMIFLSRSAMRKKAIRFSCALAQKS
ncbi:tRNA lysidine(34) synthetase TilS [Absiella sp. AM54-8XD]|uniref:tRNA lysidine(34) synthetase TilS n=1 Tax=Absiella sp. AM54-8XD TaxID=2292279 RepID=UPI001F3F44BA|nr:tRNA lysidine(34) synthetase TilS [Absiella sp. AM54-8XD]